MFFVWCLTEMYNVFGTVLLTVTAKLPNPDRRRILQITSSYHGINMVPFTGTQQELYLHVYIIKRSSSVHNFYKISFQQNHRQ